MFSSLSKILSIAKFKKYFLQCDCCYNFFTMRLLMTITLLLSFASFADENPYGSCGKKPGALEGFFTQAKKIREKCINDIFEAEKKKTEKEIEDLYAANKALDEELKKVAYKVEYNMVLCHPPRGEQGNPVREKKCSEIVQTKNNIVSRIDKLMGWEKKPLPKVEDNVAVESMAAPCPSKDELNKMQAIRYYNKKLYQTWERCVQLNP